MKKLLLLVALLATTLHAANVAVDATDARRGVFHTVVTLPAAAGPLTFHFPKWIPGEHMPTGPLMQMVGLHVRANGQEVAWRRDPVEMFAFRVDVPQGAQALEVAFDYLSPATVFGGGYGESPNATQHVIEVLWNHLLVYPGGTPTDRLTYTASLRLPAGFTFDTALPVARRDGEITTFAPVSLTTLIDSPLLAGDYVRTVQVAPDVQLTMAADSREALALPDERIAQLRNLVAETDALFGARHYRTYRWLVGLSDLLDVQGLEHHESSDNRQPERSFSDPALAPRYLSVLYHEFTHSWNGKYRRPAGLATPDYQAPMVGELLWVYEGMTRYLGDLVLTARSGFRTPEEDRDYAAYVAATLERNRPGRAWRPLVDTALAVQSIGAAPSEGVPYRRGLDYYDESMLLWLDVDTTIRMKTNGAKSLDDFARLFFGPPATAPMVKPYTLDDVVATLNQVTANDWRAFLEQRVYKVAPHPPLAALENAGWRLVFNDQPNPYHALRARTAKNTDVSLSLGFWVKDDGSVSEVVYGSPAYEAGLAPGAKLMSVNGRAFSGDVLREELRARRPLALMVQRGGDAFPLRIDYTGGEQFPHLERIEGRPDLLTDIMRPRQK